MYSFDTLQESNQSKCDCQNPRICKTNVMMSGLKYIYTRVGAEINTIHSGRIKLGLLQLVQWRFLCVCSQIRTIWIPLVLRHTSCKVDFTVLKFEF